VCLSQVLTIMPRGCTVLASAFGSGVRVFSATFAGG
jgi:hypothetical protein